MFKVNNKSLSSVSIVNSEQVNRHGLFKQTIYCLLQSPFLKNTLSHILIQ